ncbi:MAG TPA: D-alanyl-D-alanine carboxypeptidase/D-alanyl-D-alanine-endopeptidase [Streptosporangiaceae bacterium]
MANRPVVNRPVVNRPVVNRPAPDRKAPDRPAPGRLPVNRLRATMVIALAMISVFTLGAGVAVAALLPGRLALWNIPRVAARPAAAASRVLSGARPLAPVPTSRGLSAALSGVLGSGGLGKQAGAEVIDPGTGRVLFAQGASDLLQPASTTKLVTAAAALDVLGPSARLRTRVVAGASPGSIVLVGGGDPTLAAGPVPASDYPQPATLKQLAAATARALRAQGRRSVRVSYDTSLYSGPPLAPGWPEAYITTGNVTAITPLEVDQGRLTPGGAPQDADDPGNFRPRSADPAAQAASAFAAFLGADGIHVSGQAGQRKAARHAATLAAVSSPPLSAIVGWMLRESNNVIAENLARQVALREGRPASFSGAAAAVTAAARRLGVPGGIHLVDGSGLSPQDRIAPAVLAHLVSVAAAGARGRLRAAITGMPVAGFSGTLAPGQSVFSGFTARSRGLVRAKTGNLSSVATLAGLVYDASGRVLAFAFMTDQVRPANLGRAADGLDRMASALAGCGCRSR